MAITAWGRLPVARAIASAVAHAPKSSAAGIDTVGSGAALPTRRASPARSAAVIALRRSMAV
eukprot:192251-Pleurochrysis_carterae.AAC.1